LRDPVDPVAARGGDVLHARWIHSHFADSCDCVRPDSHYPGTTACLTAAPSVVSFRSPSTTRMVCVAPSLAMGMARGSIGASSRVASAMPRQRRCGFDTKISYSVEPIRHDIAYSLHEEGIHGSISRAIPRRRRPRMLSSPARYIHPAAPVYHVQPER